MRFLVDQKYICYEKSRFLSTLLFMVVAGSFAQDLELIESLKNQFPDEKAALLEKREEIFIDLSDGDLEIKSKHYLDKLMLEEGAQPYANHDIHFTPTFYDIEDIKAEVWRPKGKKFKVEPVYTIETKSNFSGSIFYDDHKYKEIKFPKVEVGNRAVVSYTERIKDPHFLSSFYFRSYMPVVKSTLSISFPSEVKINYKVFNPDRGKVKFKETTKDNITTYEWTVKDASPYKVPGGAPAISYYEPHVAVYIDEYQTASGNEKVLSDVSNLFGWYSELVSEVNQEEDAPLRSLVDSLVQGVSDDDEKIKRIFYWVQDHIKYVAFEDGLGGFIPREAGAVCDKRYGDCKDMSSITTEMLRYADIEAYLTWVGSRDIPYSYHDLPTPQVDNHMIAAVKRGDEFIFLDATGYYCPYGLPTSFIQGKEAMVGLSREDFEIVEVPVVPAEKNMYKDAVTLTIKDAAVFGKARATMDGYFKFRLTHRLKGQNTQKSDKFLRAWLQKGSNKFYMEDYKIDGLDDRDHLLTIDYQFNIEDYVTTYGDETYVNMNLDRSLENDKILAEERDSIGLEVDFKSIEKHQVTLDIPEGYKVDYLPSRASFDDEDFSFDIAYSEQDGKVILTKSLKTNTLYITPEKFGRYNEMIDALGEAYGEVIVLKKQ